MCRANSRLTTPRPVFLAHFALGQLERRAVRRKAHFFIHCVERLTGGLKNPPVTDMGIDSLFMEIPLVDGESVESSARR